MSKTVSTCILETNQILNQPQENIFFHTIYRTQADYPNEFLRTAKSTSPIQICAIFSCIGPDNFGALLNIQLNEELAKIVAQCQKQPVLDFDVFSNQVINTLNIKVCNFNVARGGASMKVSMTMVVIEGDTLRVIHLGNTKAVLVRDNKIMALTEEHTVAHNYVKANAITPDQERTHPDNMNLTQYLGKLPQDGVLNADRKVRVKLNDNDEICLMGLGISRMLPSQMRNVVLVKPLSAEAKAREIISSAFNYGVKSGLSICLIQVESTFLLPGDAAINSAFVAEAPIETAMAHASNDKEYTQLNEPYGDIADEEDYADVPAVNNRKKNSPAKSDETQKFAVSDDTQKNNRGKMNKNKNDSGYEEFEGKKPSKFWDFMIPIITLLVCVGIGYGAMYLVFNAKHLIDKIAPTTESINEDVGTIRYAINDNTPVYSSASTDSSTIGILSRGNSIETFEVEGQFLRVKFNDQTGYVLISDVTDQDPTIGEDIPEMIDNTPTPTEQSEETTASSEETTTTTTEATTSATTAATTAATTEATTTAAATEAPATEAPATEAPATEAPATEAPAEPQPGEEG